MAFTSLAPLLTRLWQPGCFVVRGGLRCAWRFESECELPWEEFRGRLLDPSATRQRRRFVCWDLLPLVDSTPGPEPILSLLWDPAEGKLHVTRGLLCHVWRAESAGNIVESTESTRWLRERVGTLSLLDPDDDLEAEIVRLIEFAVLGTSRLPLTSVEAPLPAFSFGQLAYVPGIQSELAPDATCRPRSTWLELLASTPVDSLSTDRQAKIVEFSLRAAAGAEIPVVADALAAWLPDGSLLARLRQVYNEVSLSPYTDFVDNTIAFLREAVARGHIDAAGHIDFLTGLLRQLSRHLTAYDLVLFHYRGANYPDALLLDTLLRESLRLAGPYAKLFLESHIEGRRRRRGLRMGCLLRHHYEGHAVPDQPTSPGENARVLPSPFRRVPEDQIEHTRLRSRQLFVEQPLRNLVGPEQRAILNQAWADLVDAPEARELGIALFLDRPLGFFKAPAEVDQTPLLSYEAFSRRIATQRLHALRRLAQELNLDMAEATWQSAATCIGQPIVGVGQSQIPESTRPAVSLADASRVSDDFIFMRTMRSSARRFWEAFPEVNLPCSAPTRDLPRSAVAHSRPLRRERVQNHCIRSRGEAPFGSRCKLERHDRTPRRRTPALAFVAANPLTRDIESAWGVVESHGFGSYRTRAFAAPKSTFAVPSSPKRNGLRTMS